MRVAGTHRLKRPFDKRSTFGQGAFALRPFQLGAHALVLEVRGHGHHVRVAKDLIPIDCREVMNETYQLSAGKGTQRPTSRLPRNDQMSPG